MKEGTMFTKKFLSFAGICLVLFLLIGCNALLKGNRMLGQKNYNEAIALYKEYLSENPESLEAKRKLGLAYLESGQIDPAIKQFENFLS